MCGERRRLEDYLDPRHRSSEAVVEVSTCLTKETNSICTAPYLVACAADASRAGPPYVLDSFACVTQLRVGQKGWRRVYWTIVLVTWAPAGAPWSWHRARTDTKVQSTLARRVAHPRVT
jgi:hypothetical protein